MSSFPFRLSMMGDDDRHGERLIAAVTFHGMNKNEVNTRCILIKSVEFIKWFPKVLDSL